MGRGGGKSLATLASARTAVAKATKGQRVHFGLPEVPEVIVRIAGSRGAGRGQPPGGGVAHACGEHSGGVSGGRRVGASRGARREGGRRGAGGVLCLCLCARGARGGRVGAARHRRGSAPRVLVEDIEDCGGHSGGGKGGGELGERRGARESGDGLRVVQELLCDWGG